MMLVGTETVTPLAMSVPVALSPPDVVGAPPLVEEKPVMVEPEAETEGPGCVMTYEEPGVGPVYGAPPSDTADEVAEVADEVAEAVLGPGVAAALQAK